MDKKIIVLLMFIPIIFASGCLNVDTEIEGMPDSEEDIEEIMKEESTSIPVEDLNRSESEETDNQKTGTDCSSVAPDSRNECCRKKGYDRWEGVKCVNKRNKSTSVYLVSEDYTENVLSLYVKNNESTDLSLAFEDIEIKLEDSENNVLCSGNMYSDNVSCYSGCGGHMDAKDSQQLEIDLSKCGELKSGRAYFYELNFEREAFVSGAFNA